MHALPLSPQPHTSKRVSCLFRVVVDASNFGILCFGGPPCTYIVPLSALRQQVPMPTATRVSGYRAVSAHALTQLQQQRHLLRVCSTEARRCDRGFLQQLLCFVSERKAKLGAEFCARGSKTVGVKAGFIFLDKILLGHNENTHLLAEPK